MQYSVTFRHMEPSDHLKEYGRDKLGRLEKYLDAVIDAEVVMTVEKFRHKAEVLISSDGLKIKAEEETEDMYSALDMVVDKLEKQIKRHREKLKDHKAGNGKRQIRETGAAPAEEDEPEPGEGGGEPSVDRHSNLQPSVMTVTDAMKKLAAGEQNWLLFINQSNDHLSILRLHDDGLVELIKINH